jgi:pimeloyl-ACP methyl ester carboxylesterase
VAPFSITTGEDVLDDLRARIRATRWPDPAPGEPWQQGTDLEFLRSLLGYWADGFDWRAQERELARFEHFRAELDGTWIHFVHHRGGGVPLILTHGWPSLFAEQLPLVPLLDDFDLVIPSLPGYGFSERPARAAMRDTARLWHRLMQGLGYPRYGAGGGDFGAGVATMMALDDPEPLLGLHLTTFEVEPYTGPGSRPLSEEEAAFEAQLRAWDAVERGYSSIQSTKPQTVGYGLTDSPAGLAAWILEKWRSWSDSGGDVVARLGRDFLLTLLTLYWVTGTITSSMRDYYDNRWAGYQPGLQDHVRVPTAFALFDHHFVPEGTPPREWAERLYDVTRWTPMERGGHFAAVEEPELLAADLRAFFSGA